MKKQKLLWLEYDGESRTGAQTYFHKFVAAEIL